MYIDSQANQATTIVGLEPNTLEPNMALLADLQTRANKDTWVFRLKVYRTNKHLSSILYLNQITYISFGDLVHW